MQQPRWLRGIKLQTAQRHRPFPDGASGYDEETVRVAAKDAKRPSLGACSAAAEAPRPGD
jgi:hypothetical protein